MSTLQMHVQIMGQNYVLGCPAGGQARLQAAVARVDAAMCQIRDAGKVKTRDRIAVLAALNMAFAQMDEEALPATTPATAATSASEFESESASAPPTPSAGDSHDAGKPLGTDGLWGSDTAPQQARTQQLTALLARLDAALAPADGHLF